MIKSKLHLMVILVYLSCKIFTYKLKLEGLLIMLRKYFFVLISLMLWNNLHLLAEQETIYQIRAYCAQLAFEYERELEYLVTQKALDDKDTMLRLSMESYYKRGLEELKKVKDALEAGQEDAIFSQFILFVEDFLGYGEEESVLNGPKELQKVVSKPQNALRRWYKLGGKLALVALIVQTAFAKFIPSIEAISIPLNTKYQNLCDKLVETKCPGITYGALSNIQCPSLLPIELRDALQKTINATTVNVEGTAHLCHCSELQDKSVRCLSNIQFLEKDIYDVDPTTQRARQVGSYRVGTSEACDITSRLCTYITFLPCDEQDRLMRMGAAVRAQVSYHFKPDVTAELACLKDLIDLKPSYSALEELAAIYKNKPRLLARWEKDIVDMVERNSITNSEHGCFYASARALEEYSIQVSDDFLLYLYTQSLLRQENPHALVRYHLVLQRADRAPYVAETLQRLRELDTLSRDSYENYSVDFFGRAEFDFYAACKNTPTSSQLSSCSFE